MVNFYRFLLDKTCMVSSFDANGIIRHVNEKFCIVSGYSEKEVVGSSHSLLKPGVDDEPFYNELWKEISQNRPWSGLICNKAKDGKVFWTASAIIPEKDPASENRMYHALHLPIDEPAGGPAGGPASHAASDDLFHSPLDNMPADARRSERYYHKLVNSITEVVFLTDEKGNPAYASDSVKDVLGYTAEEILQIKYTDIVHKDDQELVRKTLEELESNPGGSKTVQLRVRRKNGKLGWMEAIASNHIHDPDIKSLIINMRDIHHQKEAEENLKFQAKLLQEVTDAIVSTDSASNIISWNKAAEDLYGWKAEEVLGKKFPEMVRSTYPHSSEKEATDTINATGRWEGEVIQQTKDGSSIYFLSSVSAMTKTGQPAGLPAGFVIVNRNISERKEVEERLRFQNERLSEIAWLHAHKVRGPVATIMGLMNIYDWDDFSAEDNKDIVRKVDLVSKQLDVIIHDIVKKTGELHDDSQHAEYES